MSKLIYNDLVSVEYTNEAGEKCKCKYIGRVGYSTHFGLNEKFEVVVFFQNAKYALDELRQISLNSVFEKLPEILVKDFDEYEWSLTRFIGSVSINGKTKYLGFVNGLCHSALALYDKVK